MNINKTNIDGLAIAKELPQLFGIGDFQPSLLQCRALVAWLDSPTADSPSVTIKNLGHDYHNWYQWQKQPGFQDWWNECIDRSFVASDLRRLYKAMLQRGLATDTAAGKIFIQKYDPLFTERSSTDARHTFAGYTPEAPADTAAALERSRTRALAGAQPAALPEPEHTGGQHTPDLPATDTRTHARTQPGADAHTPTHDAHAHTQARETQCENEGTGGEARGGEGEI